MENNQKEIILLEDLGYKYPKETSKQKKKYGLYKCFCGKEFKAQVASIKSGNTISCGCYHIKKVKELRCLNITHGLRNHKLYGIWFKMVDRCNNIESLSYKHYGARGIKVCERWLDLRNFINDMYPTYQNGLSIDRINPYGNYEANNCRWTNKVTQARNTKILQVNNTSGYRGVTFRKDTHRFSSSIRVNYKIIKLRCFNTAIEAAKAYDDYVLNNNLEHTRNFS